MPYINRAIESVFLRLSGEYSALLLTGSRQTGKTTMLLKLLDEEGIGREYVSLDDPVLRHLAKTEPAMFFQLHPPPIFIDEAQYAPELFPYIKMMADRDQVPGAFWLSGSQIFRMMRGIQESLAGRVALLHLPPLSQMELYSSGQVTPFVVDLEMLKARQSMATSATVTEVYERIFHGSMPALRSGRYSDGDAFYRNYIGTYLDRDVKELSPTIDSLKFLNFLTASAALTAQFVNYKAYAEQCDVDQKTAKDWLRILEALGIIFYLRPYSNNTLKRMVKTPKLYFYDCGLVAFLTKWSSPEALQNGAMSGAILENFVVSEILKGYQNHGREPYLYYYRDRDAREIDLMLEMDGQLSPLEIKKTANPGSPLVRVFQLLDRAGLKRGMGAVVCMTEHLGAIDGENLIVPAWMV